MTDASRPAQLKRSISLPLLVSYGVGTMVGAGFYALLGRVAYHAGMQAPIALLLAAGIAVLTALTFCELSSRLPYSAGESRYVHEAFGRQWLSISIGWAVIATGIVSAATLTRAFVGFTQDLVPVPTSLAIIVFVGGLTLVTVRGILESVWLATLITVIEVGGLLWVLGVNAHFYADLPARWGEFVPGLRWAEWSGIFIGGFLAFYAFIGFEDMVNEAEEVQNPQRNLPRGILWALVLTTTLYLLIVVAAVLAFAPQDLAQARTPLALLVSRQGAFSRVAMTYISLFAGVNGALVQLIMASRVAYGMSNQGLGPRWLAVVHVKYRTPVQATLLMSGLILVFALWLPLESLAKITSAIMLVNFAAVNAALVKLKLTSSKAPDAVTCYPLWVPIAGCILCVVFLLLQLLTSPA